MNDLSLTSGPFPVIVLVAGSLGLLWLLAGDRRHLLRTVPLAMVGSLVLTLLLGFLAESVFHWWDAELPRILYVPAALTLLAALLCAPRIHSLQRSRAASVSPSVSPVVSVASVADTNITSDAASGSTVVSTARRGQGRRSAPLRLVSGISGVLSVLSVLSVLVSMVLVVVAAASAVNVHFGQFPTLASALGNNGISSQDIGTVAAGPGQPGEPPVTTGTWTAPPGMPSQGSVYSVTIPAPTSGYQSAPALVYLPPAYLGTPRATNVPVLLLLHGLPGAPVDWVNGGQLAQVMDDYAAAHQGLAPIVVLPDITNNGASNPPLCMDTTVSRSATYLAVDVPAWVKSTLGAGVTSNQQWAVAGFSYGGTCTMQLATNFPDTYPTFIDISGESEPTVPGGRNGLISTYFSGDAAAFAAQNALDRLGTASFSSSYGIIVTGAQDTTYGPQGQQVYDAAKKAGMSVTLQVLPGGHSWEVWKPGLQNNLDWLTQHLGLIGP